VRRKKYKPKLRFYIIVLSIVIVLGFILSFENNTRNKNQKKVKKTEIIEKEMTNNGKTLYISEKNLYAVYGERFILKIPLYIYISKSKKLENLVNRNRYQDVLDGLNQMLPEKLENYNKITTENLAQILNVKEKMMPTIEFEKKIYVNTYGLAMLFDEEMREGENIENNGIIDILNANGIGGYAGKVGRNLTEVLGYEYNAANYEKRTDYTYLINKKLTRHQLEQIVEQIPEKNIKIKKETGIATLADAVLILGKDNGNLTYIMIQRNKKLDYKNFEKLQKSGYRNLHRVKSKKEIKETKIEYNEEDYYTAYKISKKLGIKLLVENNNLKNRIEIKIGG